MNKLWLTYAWKDNEDEDVDFVIRELERHGLEVHFDRREIVPGQRIWPQIDKGITDPSATDAWGLYVTENSLKSEPCLEEIAYALDRALRVRGSEFPVIGIFPKPIDRSLIPSSIATRLYVNLQSADWAARVVSGVNRSKPNPPLGGAVPFVIKLYDQGSGSYMLEVRPRAGRWAPFIAAVPQAGTSRINAILSGPPDLPKVSGMSESTEVTLHTYIGKVLRDAITSENSAYVSFNGGLPDEFVFGSERGSWEVINPKSLPTQTAG